MTRTVIRNITLIWLLWVVVMIGYQQLTPERFQIQKPDDVLIWTADETNRRSQNDNPYLLDPFLNTQVSWDSEYYLAIAVEGYDSDAVPTVTVDGVTYPLSYAFFPAYPYLMRIVAIPLQIFGLSTTATATLAGLIISALGTLAGMFALFDILRDQSEKAGYNAAFYLLIFPTSFFLLTIYTEGLFVGLAFSSLALMRRKQLVLAAILAMFATWTRTSGGLLVIPLALTWFEIWLDQSSDERNVWTYASALLIGLPIVAFLTWRSANGEIFDIVQSNWFGNGFMNLENVQSAWEVAFQRAQDNPETAVYYLVYISSVLLTALASILMLRRYPKIALFSLAILFFSFTSGWTSSQSLNRYLLGVPALFMVLGFWGRNLVFDRFWTLLTILILAAQALLFSFDMWVA